MLGHKTDLHKFKSTEIILSTFSDHNSMKIEINYMKKTGKFTNMWRLNNMYLNTSVSKMKSKRNLKNLRQIKMEMQHTKIYEMQQN